MTTRATAESTNAGPSSSTAARRHDRQRLPRPRAHRLGLVTGDTRGAPIHGCVVVHGLMGAWRDPCNTYEQRGILRATLVARHTVPLLPKAPSRGNQTAHISLTARRQRHPHNTRRRRTTSASSIRDGRLTQLLSRTSLHIRCGDVLVEPQLRFAHERQTTKALLSAPNSLKLNTSRDARSPRRPHRRTSGRAVLLSSP